MEFADVARLQLPRLYSLARYLVDDDAEDLVQECLIKACQGFGGLRDPQAAHAWFTKILVNCARDRFRQRQRRLVETPLDDVEDFSLFRTIAEEDPFPYSDSLHLDFLCRFGPEDVWAVLRELPEIYRVPLVLVHMQDVATKQAARMLGLPLGTLLARLHLGCTAAANCSRSTCGHTRCGTTCSSSPRLWEESRSDQLRRRDPAAVGLPGGRRHPRCPAACLRACRGLSENVRGRAGSPGWRSSRFAAQHGGGHGFIHAATTSTSTGAADTGTSERARSDRPSHRDGSAGMTAVDANRDVARTALERVCPRGDMVLARDCYAEDFSDHVGALEFHGHDGIHRSTALYRALFDDLAIEVVDQIADGDRVANRWILTGTNRGRPIRLPGLTISRLHDGRIVEDWTAFDTLDLLTGKQPRPRRILCRRHRRAGVSRAGW